MKTFLDSRKGDIRTNAVATPTELKRGDIFYITCIDEPEKLKPFYEKYKDIFHCVYHTEIYTGEQWLEIKDKATAVIPSNDEDGVAKWLEQNFTE